MYIRSVNYYETDMMQVVHHSNYIRWFEEARTKLLDEAGYSYARIESEGIMIPVLSVNCEYKMPCRFGETVCIKSKLVEYSGVRMTIEYEVWDEKCEELRVTGRSSHCFVDSQFRPISVKRKVPELHAVFESLMAE